MIVQDDTIACRGFARAARAAWLSRPGRLITFFSRNTPPAIVQRRNVALRACDPFCEFPRGFWVLTVALLWPKELAQEFLEWPAVQARTMRTDDPIVGEWAAATERGALASVPSLVEHPDDQPSYIKSNNGNGRGVRTAACWIADTPVEHWMALLT